MIFTKMLNGILADLSIKDKRMLSFSLCDRLSCYYGFTEEEIIAGREVLSLFKPRYSDIQLIPEEAREM